MKVSVLFFAFFATAKVARLDAHPAQYVIMRRSGQGSAFRGLER